MPIVKTENLIQRNSTFRHFILAVSISLLGSSVFDLALPLYVLSRTGSVISLSLANIALCLPFFLMAPLTGYTVDHFNKRRVMLGSDMGQTLCLTLLLCFMFSEITSLWPLLLLVFIIKTLTITFETVSTFQLIPALVDSKDLSEANTWFLSTQRFIQIVGPLFAGLLLATVGFKGCIVVNVLSFSATLYFVFQMKNLNTLIEKEFGKSDKSSLSIKAVFSNFKESSKFCWNSPIFKPFICMMFIWNLSSLCPNTTTITYFFTAHHNYTEAQYGIFASFFGLTGIIGFLMATGFYKRFLFSKTFATAGLFQAVFVSIAILFYQTPIVMAVFFGISRIGGAVMSMGTFFLRQTQVPKSKMGGVNACLRMFFMSSMPLSAIAQGFLIDKFGVLPSLITGAIALYGTFFFASKTAKAYEKCSIFEIKKAAA